MKKLSFAIILMLLASCTTNRGLMTGNDKDAHGCIGSAGYTWSELLKTCIRTWEDGIRLNNTTDSTATTSAFAVFNGDSSKVEIFFPSITAQPILNKTASGTWNAKNFTLKKEGEKLGLYYKDQLVYKQ